MAREALTREQAVIAYTLAAAYSEFAEKDNSSPEPRKFADLAVPSLDIFIVLPPELAYEERDPQLTYLKAGRRFEPLRHDPRFRELVHRIGLPE